jgi:integral membrane protein (TIGR01906 family)
MINKILDRFVIILFSISILLVSIWAVIIPITKSIDFFEYEFNKNNTSENTGWYVYEDNTYYSYTNEELTYIMDTVIDYLMDEKDDMQVVINGKNVFSNQALIHMKDVKVLYTGGNRLGLMFYIITIICMIYMAFNFDRMKSLLFKYTMLTLAGILIILGAIGIFALVDFDKVFVLFHKIAFPTEQKFNDAFFSNISNYEELYYINNLTLTNILSIEVFMDAVILIFIGMFTTLTTWITFTVFVRKKVKKQVLIN